MALFNSSKLFIDASTHSGKGNLEPSHLYDDEGRPIPQRDFTATLDADGLPLKPAKISDDVIEDFKLTERYGAGILAKPLASGAVHATTSVPRARTFMFPRHSGQNILEIVYTEECNEILELIEEKMVEMAKANRKPATMLLGKHQYRQYMAVISYQQQVPTVPKTIADANIVIMDQEHYFDIVPSVDDMITHKL